MLTPLERTPFGCRACWDAGKVLDGSREIACPSCAGWSDEVRLANLRADTARRGPKPEIAEADLSDAEFAEMQRLISIHTDAHRLTVLAWIEGRRYSPAKDPEFMELCEKRLRKWRFLRLTSEGALPGWAVAALAGDDGDLSDVEREWVDGLRSSQRRAA